MMPTRSIVLACAVALPLVTDGGSVYAEPVTHVEHANPKAPGVTSPNVLSPELAEIAVAQGSTPVENPTPGTVRYYGYRDDHPNLLPAPGSNVEATKTEPDKNTYLVLRGLKGADPDYDYGTRFLFQGHEAGAPGALTRINLDADPAHRVTVLANFEADGTTALPTIDGSTWYPWSERLLLSQEGNGSTSGGLWQATPDYPSVVQSLAGVIGRGGYEGIQADSDGNVWIVEDIGGATVAGARLPNSFIYRFTPANKFDLTAGGRLQALQVISHSAPAHPIVYQSASALTPDLQDLHTYGLVFATAWVTVHDTATDGFGPFNANARAKAQGATPFKRPENGQFRPGSGFREFFFDETGDTSASSTANAAHGGFGGVMELVQSGPSAATGTLRLFFRGDLEHTSFDNCAFWDEDHVVFVEDRGDGLHTDGNALDSAWLLDVRRDYANPANRHLRLIAEGRDPSATIDSALLGTPGFQNEGDNEITGFHVSDGDPTAQGLLGAKVPHALQDGWRVFFTAQHGDNVTWEIVRKPRSDDEDGDDGRDRDHDHDRDHDR